MFCYTMPFSNQKRKPTVNIPPMHYNVCPLWGSITWADFYFYFFISGTLGKKRFNEGFKLGLIFSYTIVSDVNPVWEGLSKEGKGVSPIMFSPYNANNSKTSMGSSNWFSSCSYCWKKVVYRQVNQSVTALLFCITD